MSNVRRPKHHIKRKDIFVSKFLELCKSLSKSRAELDKYRRHCWKVGHQFVEGYKSYLDAPDGAIRVIPISSSINLETPYTNMDAMSLDENGFWQFGILISLEAGGVPPNRLTIRVRMRNTPNGLLISVLKDHEGVIIKSTDEGDFSAVYELMQSTINLYYQEGLDRFLAQPNSIRPIGFL
jgi:hypothetical protein